MQKQIFRYATCLPSALRAFFSVFSLFLLVKVSVWGQTFSIARQFTGSNTSIGSRILPLSDGTLLSAGSIGNNDDPTKGDILLIKSTSDGQTIWAKQYASQNFKGGILCQQTVPRLEFAADVVEVSDGYVLAGCHDHFEQAPLLNCGPNNHLGIPLLWEQTAARFDYLVLKVGKDGAVKWAKRYGNGKSQVATSIKKTLDGGFVLGGFTTGEWLLKGEPYRPFFLKLDANGNVQWSKVLENFDQEFSALIIPTAHKMPITPLPDGTFLFAASTGSRTRIVRLSATGDVVWSKYFDHGGAAGQIIQDWGLGAFSAAYIHTLVPLPNGHIGMVGSFMFGSGIIAPTNPPSAFTVFAHAGWYVEINNQGQLVRHAAFSRTNPDFGQNNNTVAFDFTPTDATLLSNGNLAVAGLHSHASVLLEYDLAANTNNKIRWAKQFDTWNYSLIPLSYDIPSGAVVNGNAYMITDNFKMGRSHASLATDPCHPAQKISALNLAPFTISNSNVQFSQMNQSAAVVFNGVNTSVASAKSCSGQVLYQTALRASSEVQIVPSPLMGDALTVRMDVPEAGTYRSTILDQTGRVIHTFEQSLEEGPQQFDMTTSMQNGVYFLEIRAGTGYRQVIKLVKAAE